MDKKSTVVGAVCIVLQPTLPRGHKQRIVEGLPALVGTFDLEFTTDPRVPIHVSDDETRPTILLGSMSRPADHPEETLEELTNTFTALSSLFREGSPLQPYFCAAGFELAEIKMGEGAPPLEEIIQEFAGHLHHKVTGGLSQRMVEEMLRRLADKQGEEGGPDSEHS